METITEKFNSFEKKMTAENLPAIAVENFRHAYGKLRENQNGMIPESGIDPVTGLTGAASLDDRQGLEKIGKWQLKKTVSIRLNGGLATTMGALKPKGLLWVKPTLSFLDIIVRRNLHLTPQVPLVFMNSFATRADTLRALSRYAGLRDHRLGLDFIQHKVPKVDAATLAPARHREDPSLEWCPPGHGNIYISLAGSGMLDRLLENGFRYAFISNIDNLGADVDPVLLGYFVSQGLDFMIEACRRTAGDKKGGHLARRKNGELILRETAQCPESDRHHFQDIQRYRYFNTNNIWIDLYALKTLMDRENGILDLPVIRNKKTLDPRDEDAPAVFQLETAMGSAVSLFERTGAVQVPRSRFIPVKDTADLLVVRSNRYRLTPSYRLVPHPERCSDVISIDLDPDFYGFVDKFEQRFPHGPPSLVDCESLRIYGDFRFGKKIRMRGHTALLNPTDTPYKIKNGFRFDGDSFIVSDAVQPVRSAPRFA